MAGKDFERDFKDEFSEVYAKDTFEFYKKINLKRKYFADTKVRGLEKIANDRQKIYLPNHLSHWDYVALWHLFMENDLKMPRIAAGKNLNFPKFLEKYGLNFRKQGAFFVDRDSLKTSGHDFRREYNSALSEAFNNLLDEENDLMIFTEGGRNYEGEVMPDETKIKKFTYKSLTNGNLRDLDVVPVAIGYDKRIEEKAFPFLLKANGRTNVLKKSLYFGSDLAAFAAWPLARQLGFNKNVNCYINFGEPINLEEFENVSEGKRWSALRKQVVEDVRRLYSEIEFGKTN